MSRQNIVGKYAKRTVFKNRGRTILTMFGIIIATVMFCVVLSVRSSCIDILKSFQDDDYGTWHVQAYSMTSKDYQRIMKDERIKSSAYIQEAGYILGGTDDQIEDILAYENYNVLLASMSQNFADLCNIRLVWGRLPENENEAIVSLEMYADNKDIIKEDGADVFYQMTYYSRYSEGHKVNDLKQIHRTKDGKGNEYLYEIDTIEFKIVGYYVIPEYTRWKNLSRYTVLLGSSNLTAGNAVNAYFELNDPADYTAFAEEYFESNEDCLFNKDFIRMEDSADDTKAIRWLDILVLNAVLFILLLAVMLIYNSFSTSSTERIRAIGLLKSVGATKRQVRDLMFSEAFYYIVIAVPIGILLGNLSALILFARLSDYVKEAGFYLLSQTVDLNYRLGFGNTVCPAFLSIVTILIAILIPMVRTSNITPIEAVRVNNVFTTKPLRKSSRGLSVKIFGFTGALALKNFFRYRKRYHAPILSILLSILMILCTHTLVRVIDHKFSDASDTDSDLLIYSYYFGDNTFDTSDLNLYYQLADMKEVKDSLIILQVRKDMKVDPSVVTASYKRIWPSEDSTVPVAMMFIEDSDFRRICTENGIDPEPYLTYGSRLCLTNSRTYVEEDGRYNEIKVFNDNLFPASAQLDFDGSGERETRTIDVELTQTIPEPFGESEKSSMTQIQIYVPLTRMNYYSSTYRGIYEYFTFHVDDPEETHTAMKKMLEANLHSGENLHDTGAYARAKESVTTLSRILIYGFAILLCLICFLNVIMTLLTSLLFRRKEYILLNSVGMSRKTLFRMVITESMICFMESLIILAIVMAILLFVIMTVMNIDVFSKRNILFVAITLGIHFLMVTSTTAIGLRHVLSENVIEGIRKDYY